MAARTNEDRRVNDALARAHVEEVAQEEFDELEAIRVAVSWEPVEIGDRIVVSHPSAVYFCPDCGAEHLRGVVTRVKTVQDEVGRESTTVRYRSDVEDPEHARKHNPCVWDRSVLKTERTV